MTVSIGAAELGCQFRTIDISNIHFQIKLDGGYIKPGVMKNKGTLWVCKEFP